MIFPEMKSIYEFAHFTVSFHISRDMHAHASFFFFMYYFLWTPSTDREGKLFKDGRTCPHGESYDFIGDIKPIRKHEMPIIYGLE